MLTILFLIFSSFMHDIHLSMCNLKYNEEYQRIEIQQRVFYDDLELSLRSKLGDQKFDILAPEVSAYSYDSIFHDYINTHISLHINEKSYKLEFLEYETIDEAVVMYMYVPDIQQIEKIEVFSAILFELYDDQNNIISITVGKEKKSARFSQGSKNLVVQF